MGFQGTMHHSRSNYRSGYRHEGTSLSTADNRFGRRHGPYSELRVRTDTRKAHLMRKGEDYRERTGKRPIRFNFLHHSL